MANIYTQYYVHFLPSTHTFTQTHSTHKRIPLNETHRNAPIHRLHGTGNVSARRRPDERDSQSPREHDGKLYASRYENACTGVGAQCRHCGCRYLSVNSAHARWRATVEKPD